MEQADKRLEQKLMALGITRTVYSFYFPEVKEVVHRLWNSNPQFLFEKPYLRKVSRLHEEFAEKWLSWIRPISAIDRQNFPYFYPCAGSSEAIRDLISHIAVNRGRIHVFQGDYEGYRAYATAYSIEVVPHDRENYAATLNDLADGDYFFISQPSSLDGNHWTGFHLLLKHIETHAPNLKVAVDLCYAGSTSSVEKIDLDSPVIEIIFFSLSKVYGVYFHRIGGVFRRKPSLSLTGNEYFRNNFSLYLGKELLGAFAPCELPRRYVDKRNQALAPVEEILGEVTPSQVIMLATVKPQATELHRYITRNKFLRVCLTPALDKVSAQ